jgi:hypothetical protein
MILAQAVIMGLVVAVFILGAYERGQLAGQKRCLPLVLEQNDTIQQLLVLNGQIEAQRDQALRLAREALDRNNVARDLAHLDFSDH